MSEVKLDHAEIARFLKSSEIASTIHAFAEEIAQRVRSDVRALDGEPADVVVDDYRTDRAASSVTIRDARGRLWQVQHGVLTRAAASVGLEVTER